MTTPYIIDYTDPLKASFSIPPYGFNGPGGNQSNTTMRLYGRGALNWGESVDENLVRLTENFFGATAPLSGSDGQVWLEAQLYWHNTTAGVYDGWYVYNLVDNDWDLVNGTGTVASSAVSTTLGSVYYDAGASTFYLYESLYKQQPADWIPRAFTVSTVAPTASDEPVVNWKTYNSHRGEWLFHSNAIMSATAPDVDLVKGGNTWINTTDGSLSYFNGTDWVSLVASESIIDMGGNNLINLPDQTYELPDSNNAASIKYVNTAITTVVGDVGADYVLKAGDTMTGALVLAGNPVNPLEAAPMQYVVAKAGDTMTGFLTLHADPVNDFHAATKQYVDDAIAGSSGGGSAGIQGWISFNPTTGVAIDSYNLTVSKNAVGNYTITIDPSVQKGNTNYTLIVGSAPQNAYTSGSTYGTNTMQQVNAWINSRGNTSFVVYAARKFNTFFNANGTLTNDGNFFHLWGAVAYDPSYISVALMWAP
jgi:hypothetical protein